jgi:hypothetical protein
MIERQLLGIAKLKKEISALLAPDEIIDVVYKRLYFHGGNHWSTRSHYDMSGYPLDHPELNELLKEFVYASIGVEIPEEIINKNQSLILESLLMKMHETLERLRGIKE